MSKVAFVKIDYRTGIEQAVRQAMLLADWKKYVKGQKIFVKINAMSSQLVPGLNTSPFVLESIIKVLRENFSKAEISIGDTDLATVKQLEHAAKLWGYIDIAEKYGCKFVNLEDEKIVETKFDGSVFKRMLLPECVAEADCIISVPVLKTHGLTKITCALKNSWGFLPRFRHQYHLQVDRAIAEMNKAIKVDFVVVDATICIEGKGPRTGRPKICDVVMAGSDRVAIDSTAAKFAGISGVRHIAESVNIGVGNTSATIFGDKFFANEFDPPQQNIVFFWEVILRKIPGIKHLFFGPLFNFFAWLVTQYNTKWWYWTVGKKERDRILKHEFYGRLYRKLIES